MPVESDAVIREILGLDPIAVVECSASSEPSVHEVSRYLREQGYEVRPVSRSGTDCFGRPAADSLTALEGRILTVCVSPSVSLEWVREQALERGDVRVLWLLSGGDSEAIARAEAAGLTVVVDEDPKIEHRRLFG